MTQELTPWFDGAKHKPRRVGVYQQMSGSDLGYQYWDGSWWACWYRSAEEAMIRRDARAAIAAQSDNWRGLAQKPARKARNASE